MHAAARLFALLCAVIVLLPMAHGTDPAVAKKQSRTVTRSFSHPGQITIPASANQEGPADPFPATIQAGGFRKAKIKDVELTLRDFSHPIPQQVDVLLVAPNGRDAMVMSDAGGNTPAVDVTLTLDDEAGEDVPGGLASGTFRPANLEGLANDFFDPALGVSGNVALSVFDGANPNGAWQLFVMDDADPTDGSIGGGWSLEITARVKKKK